MVGNGNKLSAVMNLVIILTSDYLVPAINWPILFLFNNNISIRFNGFIK